MSILSVVTIFKFGSISELDVTVSSVRNQGCTDVEHILVLSDVVDEDFIYCRFNNSNNKLILNNDSSLYNAMNIGLQIATGDYIIFLNGGDSFFDCNSVKNILNLAKPTRCLAFRSLQYFDSSSFVRPSIANLCDLRLFPAHQAFIAPLPAAKSVLFDEERLISADFVWMNILISKYGIYISPLIISRFALGGISNFPTVKTVALKFQEIGTMSGLSELIKLLIRVLLGPKKFYKIILQGKCDLI